MGSVVDGAMVSGIAKESSSMLDSEMVYVLNVKLLKGLSRGISPGWLLGAVLIFIQKVGRGISLGWLLEAVLIFIQKVDVKENAKNSQTSTMGNSSAVVC